MREEFAGIGFRVVLQGSEAVYPGWQPTMRIVERLIPGSGELARYDMGGGMAMATVSLVLELDSPANYMALQAMLGRTAELVLRSHFTNARGISKWNDGVLWEHLPDTTLVNIGPPSYEIGGVVGVTATFRRAFNPLTGKAEP